jgi:hypothetical protein
MIYLICAGCFSQERIEEKVSVNWWVVPLFAVDQDGNAVTVLKKEIAHRGNNIAHFAIINPRVQAVLLQADKTQKAAAPSLAKVSEIKPMADEFKYSTEMGAILEGAADYCGKLKQSAFHFFCTEKIVETISGKYGWVSKFTFNYQLLKKENEIQEQRKLISKKKEHEDEENAMATLRAYFLAEKVVFVPIDLFARERQPLYEYRFIAYEKKKGIRCAVIEILPRNPEDTRLVNGQAWIDMADHSVLKIQVNPRSVVGYEKLQAIARDLNAKLHLNLEISFEKTHIGLRFPSLIVISERYRGGKLHMAAQVGLEGWERNRTEYSYRDYRFFEVGVQTTEKLQ